MPDLKIPTYDQLLQPAIRCAVVGNEHGEPARLDTLGFLGEHAFQLIGIPDDDDAPETVLEKLRTLGARHYNGNGSDIGGAWLDCECASCVYHRKMANHCGVRSVEESDDERARVVEAARFLGSHGYRVKKDDPSEDSDAARTAVLEAFEALKTVREDLARRKEFWPIGYCNVIDRALGQVMESLEKIEPTSQAPSEPPTWLASAEQYAAGVPRAADAYGLCGVRGRAPSEPGGGGVHHNKPNGEPCNYLAAESHDWRPYAEALRDFRDFVLIEVRQWSVGAAPHTPMWARVADLLEKCGLND